LTADQKQLLKFMNDANLTSAEVEENLRIENIVQGRPVTFADQEVRAILAAPANYGLPNLGK
jgi:hypothetical protein